MDHNRPAYDSDDMTLEYSMDAEALARALLGATIMRNRRGVITSGMIIETEAYLGEGDAASHSFGGRRTARNESMYLPGGHAYVYFIYGMHHCLNVVCGTRDEGTAVLIRALEPRTGIPAMQRRRKHRDIAHLASGPGRLCRAMAIDRTLDGIDLRSSRQLWLETLREPVQDSMIERTPRIGLSCEGTWAEAPLRFLLHQHETRG